jgi:hypothetical protein
MAPASFAGEHENWESFTVDLATKLEQRLPIPKTDLVEDWSPDGKLVTVVASNPKKVFKHPNPKKGNYPLRQLYLLKLEGAKREEFTIGVMQDNIYSRFSPDGNLVAYGQRRDHEDGSLSHSIMVRDSDGKREKERNHQSRQAERSGRIRVVHRACSPMLVAE